MQKFNKFYFKGFDFDKQTLKASFFYGFDDIVEFVETISFKSDGFKIIENIDENILQNLLFHLSIALGISYYKSYPTKELIVKSGYLDDYQISFWKNFYLNGLGEFFYTNDICPKGLFNFVNTGKKIKNTKFNISNKKALIPIGGGKDSLVSVELFKKYGIKFDNFTFGKDYTLHSIVSEVIGAPRLIIKRDISKELFRLNSEGYYNGHIPITGIIAFVMEVVAYLYDYKYLVLSNEKSANYANLHWQGFDVNHQYSKSLDFEKDFSKYVSEYISEDTKYFSFLRGMYELKIAEIFSKYDKYFDDFSSCNNNFKIIKKDGKKTSRWCLDCPKCAFVFAILRPYITDSEMLQIFGNDMYKQQKNKQIFSELLGLDGIKPFECVGTNEEVVLAMYKTIKNGKYDEFPYILKIFESEIYSKMTSQDFENLENKIMKIYDEDIIPSEIKPFLKN